MKSSRDVRSLARSSAALLHETHFELYADPVRRTAPYFSSPRLFTTIMHAATCPQRLFLRGRGRSRRLTSVVISDLVRADRTMLSALAECLTPRNRPAAGHRRTPRFDQRHDANCTDATLPVNRRRILRFDSSARPPGGTAARRD